MSDTNNKNPKATNLGKTFDDEWCLNMSKSRSGVPKKKRRFTEEQEKEICRKYTEDKKGTTILAQEYNCTSSLIVSIMDRHGVKRRTQVKSACNIFTKEQEQEICNLFKAGNVIREDLAKQFKCSNTTVRNILLRNNVDMKRSINNKGD